MTQVIDAGVFIAPEAARTHARLAVSLEWIGLPIGMFDLLGAATGVPVLSSTCRRGR